MSMRCRCVMRDTIGSKDSRRQPVEEYPLAVITPALGVRSETFIHRHMTGLLPGRTAIVAARTAFPVQDTNVQSSVLVFDKSKRSFNWMFHSFCYLLGLEKFSPIQALLARYLRRRGVEVILSEYLDKSLRWLDLARAMGIRFYAHAHGYDVSQSLLDPFMRRSYLRLEVADGIITVSEYSKRKLVELGLTADKIHVIPCGVEVPELLPDHNHRRDEIRCLAAGRMVAKKAPGLLIEAFRQALRMNSRLRLDYIGDGELFNEAGALVRQHGLEDKITLHGNRAHDVVLGLMSTADIFLQHSRTDPATGDEEGLPVAILEAMAQGLPVVATRHAGIPEAVIDGATGYLVNSGDVAGMATAIARLANQPELRMRLGEAGWRRASLHFSWQRERLALLELLNLSRYAGLE